MKASIRAAINRENAAHSTGPVTAAGKVRSSRNAWKHGLTSQVFIHTEDERPAYLEFGQELIIDLRPVGAIEIQLAQKIVDSHWRLNRVPAIENNLLNSPAPRPGRFRPRTRRLIRRSPWSSPCLDGRRELLR